MKAELVFIPLPAEGHMFSALQLAKLLVSRDANLSIRILLFKNDALNSCIQSLYTETTQGIQFMEIPEPEEREKSSGEAAGNHFFFLMKLVDRHKPHVKDLVAQLRESASSKLVGFVLDMFSLEMMDVADEFELPTYLYYTSSAASLGLWDCFKSLADDHNVDITEYRDSETEFSVPTYINPVPAKLFPSPVFYKESLALSLKLSGRIMETKGVMINTFQDMESYALKALSSGPEMPPVYPIGPIINFDGMNANPQETQILLSWLDDQPSSSVVFLCFGSCGFFDDEQVKKIANAIERSGCRFLWSLRRAPSKGQLEQGSDTEFHEEVLPEGFLRRTSGVGKVIGWAPQVQVLGHPAVGGFVTHCGWNSMLESVWFGVPMAAWPMYAEQQMNALQIVKDIGLAMEIKIDYTTDPLSAKRVVKSDEIEDAIRKLMNPGGELRTKTKEAMEKSRRAMAEVGSSFLSLESLLGHLHGVHVEGVIHQN